MIELQYVNWRSHHYISGSSMLGIRRTERPESVVSVAESEKPPSRVTRIGGLRHRMQDGE